MTGGDSYQLRDYRVTGHATLCTLLTVYCTISFIFTTYASKVFSLQLEGSRNYVFGFLHIGVLILTALDWRYGRDSEDVTAVV